ncbi:MAG: hypothetical protein LBD41_00150, partial [Clostridiales Family XIII bacterium]|nr:hypothetical protein [Clostridiales Family XIII bacterium]
MKDFLLPNNTIIKNGKEMLIFNYSNYISLEKFLFTIEKDYRKSSTILLNIVNKILEKIITAISYMHFPKYLIQIESKHLNIISLDIEKIFISNTLDIRFILDKNDENVILTLLEEINENFENPAIKKIIKRIENENPDIFICHKIIE